MQTSDQGKQFIRNHEGLRLKAYPDPGTGSEPWTIGYGHTGPSVKRGLTISEATAKMLLTKDLQKHEEAVENALSGEVIPQGAFDALVSFDFNTGALHRSTLLRKHLQGDYSGAAQEFHRWKWAGGRVLPGLVRRRAKEAEMYLDAMARHECHEA